MNGIFPGYIWGDSVEWYFGYLGKKRGISGEEVYQEVAGETALGYLPHSSEIAGSVVFFASDLSKPVTGQSLDVNCGHWMATVIKLTVLVKRNPALSVEEFHEEWRAHGRMIADEPVFARYIRRYEQHHRVPADYRNGDTFDGMVLQWFDSYADFLALLQTPEYAAKMQPDETRILDLPRHGDPVHRGGRGVHVVTAPRERSRRSAPTASPAAGGAATTPSTSTTTTASGATPLRDERALFELLCLEGFQAGLSWITILRKREAFREAFEGFDPTVVARLRRARRRAAARQPGHRAPPRQDHRHHRQRRARSAPCGTAGTSLEQIVWSHAPAARRGAAREPVEIPAETPESAALARALRKWGMRFVGATTVYAFMQSAGLVDDHLAGCHRAGTGSDHAPAHRRSA